MRFAFLAILITTSALGGGEAPESYKLNIVCDEKAADMTTTEFASALNEVYFTGKDKLQIIKTNPDKSVAVEIPKLAIQDYIEYMKKEWPSVKIHTGADAFESLSNEFENFCKFHGDASDFAKSLNPANLKNGKESCSESSGPEVNTASREQIKDLEQINSKLKSNSGTTATQQ